jgi:hypothetical protein
MASDAESTSHGGPHSLLDSTEDSTDAPSMFVAVEVVTHEVFWPKHIYESHFERKLASAETSSMTVGGERVPGIVVCADRNDHSLPLGVYYMCQIQVTTTNVS